MATRTLWYVYRPTRPQVLYVIVDQWEWLGGNPPTGGFAVLDGPNGRPRTEIAHQSEQTEDSSPSTRVLRTGTGSASVATPRVLLPLIHHHNHLRAPVLTNGHAALAVATGSGGQEREFAFEPPREGAALGARPSELDIPLTEVVVEPEPSP